MPKTAKKSSPGTTNTTTAKKRGRQPDASSKSGQVRELLKTGMSAVVTVDTGRSTLDKLRGE